MEREAKREFNTPPPSVPPSTCLLSESPASLGNKASRRWRCVTTTTALNISWRRSHKVSPGNDIQPRRTRRWCRCVHTTHTHTQQNTSRQNNAKQTAGGPSAARRPLEQRSERLAAVSAAHLLLFVLCFHSAAAASTAPHTLALRQ